MSIEMRIAELERKLNNLIRIGTITGVDIGKKKATVNADGIKTDWLPWLTRKSAANNEWWHPEAGEQVVLLSPQGKPTQGIILPSLAQSNFDISGAGENIHRTNYQNGDYVQHDNDSYTIAAKKIILLGPVEQRGGDITSEGVSQQFHQHKDTQPAKGLLSGKPKK